MLLRIWRNGIRQAVQINAVFAQRLAVVGKINQTGGEFVLVRFQEINCFINNIVDIQHGIIVRVH